MGNWCGGSKPHRRTAAWGRFGQLESPWPVHGSVLVDRGTAYFAAGRSSHLDGGLQFFALDALTGELQKHRVLAGPDYGVNDIQQNYRTADGSAA